MGVPARTSAKTAVRPGVGAPLKRRREPRQQRSHEMIDAILDAAVEVLVEDGYDLASTNRIARAAGVSIGSLYHYFPNKEAVVAALIERFTRQAEQIIGEQMTSMMGEPYPVIARAVMDTYVGFLRRKPELVRVIMEQIPRLGNIHKVSTVEQRLARALRIYLTRHQEALGIGNIEAAIFVTINTISLLGSKIALDPPPGATSRQLIDEVAKMLGRYVGQPA